VRTGDDWRARFRPDVPSPARIYDYLLGGKDNYPADRKAAEDLLAAVPDARWFAQQNRSGGPARTPSPIPIPAVRTSTPWSPASQAPDTAPSLAGSPR